MRKIKAQWKGTLSDDSWLKYKGNPVAAKTVMKLWFNAHFFHSDIEKEIELEELNSVLSTEISRHCLFMAVHDAGLAIGNLNKSIAALELTAIATTTNTYSISGTIITGGNALAWVTVSTAEGSVTNDTSGNYIISGLANGSYTLTPSKIGYTFTPVNIFTMVNGANIPGINFTATSTITNGTTTGTVQLPKTGQTVSSAAGDDGSVRKGIAWPNPRFTDNGNGTVTDNLTGLIWLKNASCFNMQMWTTALASANTLASGACGLNDGTSAGQWRLPNINELESLVDISQSPALPTGHPFLSVQSGYWSASSYPNDTSYAWYIYMNGGNVFSNEKRYGSLYVWPVREGQ